MDGLYSDTIVAEMDFTQTEKTKTQSFVFTRICRN